MAKIERLLQRRTDLSTFLVHLTRRSATRSARDNLFRIAEDRTIEARSAFGMAQHLERHLDGTAASQKAVCFTETPLEHAWMMIENIEGRSVKMAPYGLVFTRSVARLKHCNPIWYLDISTRGGPDWLTVPVNQMVDEAEERCTTQAGKVEASALAQEAVLRLTPFLEQMGPIGDGKRKEFWWEREWRHAGDFEFRPRDIVTLLLPEAEHEDFAEDLAELSKPWARRRVPLLDPTWGLERMIAGLAGVDADVAGPFPSG